MSESGLHPSTLCVLWPWDDPPLEQELFTALGEAEEVDDEDEINPPDDALCGLTVRVQGHPVQVLVWAGRRDSAPPPQIEMMRDWPDEAREAALRCKWEIGVETLLNPNDPLATYHTQLRLCSALSPEAPALFDVSSCRLFAGQRLRRMAESGIPPETETLFSVHAVTHGPEQPDSLFWLHTHGLWRADLPEIDMVQVPADALTMGATLINDLADLLIGTDVSDSEDRFEVGVDAHISWRPWGEVVRALPAGACGGREDRECEEDGGVHGGRRIVIGSFGRGAGGRVWQAPTSLLKRLGNDDAVCYKTVRETQRRAARARETWPEFAMLFVRHHTSVDWKFTAKFAYPVDSDPPADPDDPGAREHLWVLVHEIAGRRIRGELLNAPIHVKHLREGDVGWHDEAMLTDWFIRTPTGRLAPTQVEGAEGAGLV